MANQKKYYTQTEVDEYVHGLLTNSEIALTRQAERIEKERKENERLLKELEEYKKKEKAIARLLILSERKAKFLETNTRSRCAMEIERLARLAERWDSFFAGLENKYNVEDKKKLDEFKNQLVETINNMLDMENIFDAKPLSDAEKAHNDELARLGIIREKKQSDLDNRFDRLVQEFNMKIGDTVTRKRGRPKKNQGDSLNSIEKNLKGKKPTAITEVYPPVGDSGFDFEEALNPTDSLEDIMRDLLGDNFPDDV